MVVFNFMVWGYEVIDGVKVWFEVVCLGMVLCVDIVVFVVRDGVVFVCYMLKYLRIEFYDDIFFFK